MRKQKTDKRDASHILKLLLEGRFPRLWMPTSEQRDLRQLLIHRHKLVEIRSRVKNGLQHLALNRWVRKKGRLWSVRGRAELEKLPRGGVGAEPQAWLDAYRAEYNEARPHEALHMQTPAIAWRPSGRRYDPHPKAWEYPEGAWTLKVDCQGTIDIQGRRWRIGKTLAGERVHIQPVEERFLIFYCSTLVRELQPSIQRSTIVERWIEAPQPESKV